MCDTHYRAFRRGRIEAPTEVPPKRPRNRGHQKQCEECGADFIAPTSIRKYCMKTCLDRARKRRHPTKYMPPVIASECICKACGGSFQRTSRFGPTPRECTPCRTKRRQVEGLAAGYSRKHYLANRERYRELGRAWKAANRELVREAAVRHEAIRRARLAKATIVEFDAAQLAARLSMFPGCWMCGAPWSAVEHVKPLAGGGPHILANLRPSCTPCNSSKGGAWRGVTHVLSLRSRSRLTA